MLCIKGFKCISMIILSHFRHHAAPLEVSSMRSSPATNVHNQCTEVQMKSQKVTHRYFRKSHVVFHVWLILIDVRETPVQ